MCHKSSLLQEEAWSLGSIQLYRFPAYRSTVEVLLSYFSGAILFCYNCTNMVLASNLVALHIKRKLNKNKNQIWSIHKSSNSGFLRLSTFYTNVGLLACYARKYTVWSHACMQFQIGDRIKGGTFVKVVTWKAKMAGIDVQKPCAWRSLSISSVNSEGFF